MPPAPVWLLRSYISCSWVAHPLLIWGTLGFRPGAQAVCLIACPCVKGRLLTRSRGTGGAGLIYHFLICVFGSPWVDVEDETGWGVGLLLQGWSPCSLPMEGRSGVNLGIRVAEMREERTQRLQGVRGTSQIKWRESEDELRESTRESLN